jgi:uridylate kinase
LINRLGGPYTESREGERDMITTRIISLGGSIIAPGAVDTDFLQSFRRTILAHLEAEPERRLILVCGGGAPAREYQRAYRETLGAFAQSEAAAEAQDWIGIAATWLNAELLRQLFQPLCPEKVVTDPTAVTVFPGRVLVAAGWKPGFSTDYDAVLLAERFQAELLINLSNISKVYSADPRKDPSARPLNRLSWGELQKLVGRRWQPGINVPFDPVATEYAAKLKLTLIVADGKDTANLKHILEGRPFEGSVVGPA